MLTKLINKIRSILAPERECPCVICFNERRLDDDCFVYLGKTFTWDQFYAKRREMQSRFEAAELYLTPADWQFEYNEYVKEELWDEADERARA